jgi:hypothetical protein
LGPAKALEFFGDDALGFGFGALVPPGRALAGNRWRDEPVEPLAPLQGAFLGLLLSPQGFFLRPFGPFELGALQD